MNALMKVAGAADNIAGGVLKKVRESGKKFRYKTDHKRPGKRMIHISAGSFAADTFKKKRNSLVKARRSQVKRGSPKLINKMTNTDMRRRAKELATSRIKRKYSS